MDNEKAMQIIAIGSGKGGVGKSSVSSNLAMILANNGYKVGLIDADIYGPTQSKMFGTSNEQSFISSDGMIQPIFAHGVNFVSVRSLIKEDAPLIWRAPIAIKLIREFLSCVKWPKLDYLLIDLPPGTGDIHLTLSQQAKLTGAIIVTTPQEIACEIAEKGLQLFNKVNVPILGIIENMSGYNCIHCGQGQAVFKQGGAKKLASNYNTALLGEIHLDHLIIECNDSGTSVIHQYPNSKVVIEYQRIAKNMLDNISAQITNLNEPNAIEIMKNNLKIVWSDHSSGLLTAETLRQNCPCANCVKKIVGGTALDKEEVSKDISILELARVGCYAVKLKFSDGHNTGIFSYDNLRNLCGSNEC